MRPRREATRSFMTQNDVSSAENDVSSAFDDSP
jgi:hypothetical protein